MFRRPPDRIESIIERIESMMAVTDDVARMYESCHRAGVTSDEFYICYHAAKRLYEIKEPTRRAEAEEEEYQYALYGDRQRTTGPRAAFYEEPPDDPFDPDWRP